jgi:glycosyltransferase involved in cell wall biosynthesis
MVVTTGSIHPEVGRAPLQEGRRSALKRVCILSDDLSGAPDEGVKKFSVALAAALGEMHHVRVISVKGPCESPGVTWISAPRTFVSRRLGSELRRQDPDVIVYAARGSATFFSFLRSRMLRLYCPRAKVVLLGLQTRRHSPLQQRVIPHLRPDLLCVQSAANREYLENLGCTVDLVSSGVDTDTFRPADPETRRELRARYGFASDIPVVLHVGHLTSGRRVRVLAELAARRECQVVLVASSSTEQEASLGEQLREAGVKVLTEYQQRIEHLYQLADCYVFPVESTNNAIEAPLSVLEALACDVPVVTTRFGGLPGMFPVDADAAARGLIFVDSPAELIEETLRMCGGRPEGARDLVLRYSWDSVARAMITRALRTGRIGAATG